MIDLLIQTIGKDVPVSAGDIGSITSRFHQKRYRRGDILLSAGQVPQDIFFVLDGVLHQYYIEENGAEHSCNFTFEKEWVTDLEAFQKRTESPSTIQAMSDTAVLAITYDDFSKLVTESPAVSEYFQVLVARIAEQGIRRTKALLSFSPEKRFTDLAREQPELLRRVPQRYVAQYLGMTPESLSRIKKIDGQREILTLINAGSGYTGILLYKKLMQTILGSGGAIGNLLAKELKHYTDHVRLVARNPAKVNADDALFPADLLDRKKVIEAVQGSDVVYLMAGLPYSSKVWEQQWPVVMQNTIEACLQTNASLVFLDNVYMYAPDQISNMTETSQVGPCSKKGLVRARIQQMLLDAVNTRGLHALIARSADFYGPSVANSPLAIMVLDELRKGKKAFWQMDDTRLHAFTYVPDAAKALALLGNTGEAYGEIWHLPTSSEKVTGKEFVAIVASAMGTGPRYYLFKRWMMRAVGIFVPIVRELGEMAYQYDRDYVFDSSKFEDRFGFSATSYSNGIAEMVRVG